MLFIMEGIDLAGVVDSDFQGIQINFAPPRPAGFANFRGAGRGGARLAFLRGGAGQPFFRGAGRGGAGRTSLLGGASSEEKISDCLEC